MVIPFKVMTRSDSSTVAEAAGVWFAFGVTLGAAGVAQPATNKIPSDNISWAIDRMLWFIDGLCIVCPSRCTKHMPR